MIRIRKILYPTDFSPASQPALLYAVFLARMYGAELHLMHAIVLHEDDPYNPAFHFPNLEAASQRLNEIASESMAALLAKTEIRDIGTVTAQRYAISAAPAIAEYASEGEADLIVMGTHGRRGFRKFVLGSVAGEVLRTASCPVLVVRGQRGTPPPFRSGRILVATDLSQHSKEVLAVGCGLARVSESGLDLVHVLEDLIHPAFYNMGASRVSDLQPDILERIEKSLEDLVTATSTCEEIQTECFAREGHPDREILRLGVERGSGLIVLADQGQRGLNEVLFGSTAERVVARAECPVLMLKPFGRSLVV